MQAQLEQLGFRIDISKMKGQRYVCAVRDGVSVLEEVSSEIIKNKSFSVIPGLKAKTTTNFGESEIKFDGTVPFEKHGMRICVFDDETGNIVSNGTIYNENGELKLYVDSAE